MARGVIDKEAVRRRFDRAAGTYDAHSRVQQRMALQLLDALEGEPRTVLELGCGTGFLTELLRRRLPQAEITAVDFAPAMVERAAARVPSASFVVGDIEELDFAGRFDAIVSNATFQWFVEPARTIDRLAKVLAPVGQLLVTTFGPATFQELQATLRGLGHDPELMTRSANEWEAFLVRAGLHEIRTTTNEERLSYPDCATFLRSVKAAGASYTRTHLSPPALAEVMRRYDSGHRVGEGVVVTYEVFLLAARAPDR